MFKSLCFEKRLQVMRGNNFAEKTCVGCGRLHQDLRDLRMYRRNHPLNPLILRIKVQTMGVTSGWMALTIRGGLLTG